ncbi:CRISPR-associated endonuclease Cas3'' [Paludisphaera sp.]|uniref:CRISPR-associated endonuclease Cas3'' n=1 Tax=Paludisphaera sp. TaxID=2017432 RepID=UPI00301D51E5
MGDPSDRRRFAHTLAGFDVEHWQPLIRHLEGVAKLAAGHAAAFDSREWGRLAGLWHDLGKYADDFQAYLMCSAPDPGVVDASVVDGARGRVDHSTAGAVRVLDLCGGRLTREGKMPAAEAALAMVIAGHHGGLPGRLTFEADRLNKPERRARLDAARRDGGPEIDALLDLGLPAPPAMLRPGESGGRTDRDELKRESALRHEFWTRMLFSALIDADRLDTERFMDREKWAVREAARPGVDILENLRERVDRHLETVASASRANSGGLSVEARSRAEAVLGLRAGVLAACRRAAAREPGRHSLTVPTGGGKTLAALAFGLDHAIRHGLRRVIVVIPFTSIIDQTAKVYREAFGGLADALVEHHSNLDPSWETYENRLASENWEAPVIVTTSVQFFESLFSARGTAARKLHNIARSVVVFDEVQALPHHLRTPIFDSLNRLVDHYGVSSLFCTATQPALDLARSNRQPFPNLPGVVEVVDDVQAGFAAVAGRVEVDFSRALTPMAWEELAAELIDHHPRVLAIVQRRDDARDLCRLLPTGTFHLSALMCAAHRRDVLARIAEALKEGGPCRVVSTTLVEAGVDLDFPVVYRDLGGVDALAQAAGRCNREGRLADERGRPIPGRLIVFRSPSDPPPGLKLGAETTASLLAEQQGWLDLFDPATYRVYFSRYLDDVTPDSPDVMGARCDRDFPETQKRFRMIEDQARASIVVPYGEADRRIEAYRVAPGRSTLRALQPYVVDVPQSHFAVLLRGGVVETIHEQVHRLRPVGPDQYHRTLGLDVRGISPGSPGDWIA